MTRVVECFMSTKACEQRHAVRTELRQCPARLCGIRGVIQWSKLAIGWCDAERRQTASIKIDDN